MSKKNKSMMIVFAIFFLSFFVIRYFDYIFAFLSKYKGYCIYFFLLLFVAFCAAAIYIIARKKRREKLLSKVLHYLNLERIDSQLCENDDRVTVKSRQTLSNYDDLKYFKDKGVLEIVAKRLDVKRQIKIQIQTFLKDNQYKTDSQYDYVLNELSYYLQFADGFRVLIVYVTPAGNVRGDKTIYISQKRVEELKAHPELLMTKTEYNKVLKEQAKEELNKRKHELYDRVNSIIDYANKYKDSLTVHTFAGSLDSVVEKLFDRTINSIQKISKLESDEWEMLEDFISSSDEQIHKIVQNDQIICEYYASEPFIKIKETCSLLTQSQREFNEYIDEKARSIALLFGTRVVRNETINDDTYNYIRAYKKTITPFTAEVSSTVFGSAENSPITYIVKYFYPNKSQYPEQIEKLRLLIGELETLKEAKVIIGNYKKAYAQYIEDVPNFVLDNDESGFYSRLGLTIIDESILNVEYKFVYTSDGGMAQRSFTVPMNEENIAELISQLENKLSLDFQVREQRALMTSKLRVHIKERDNYTCCQCGNSIYNEPNLLLEIDHIIPVSRGGLTREDNLQTLCWKCNRNKGSKLI